MSRLFLSLAVVVSLAGISRAADEPAKAPTAEEVQSHPDDAKALNAFLSARFRELGPLLEKDADAAEKGLADLDALLDKLMPTDPDAKQLVSRGKSSIKSYRDILEIKRLKLEDLEKALTENPDDAATAQKWTRKIVTEIGAIARGEPEEAERKLAAAREFAGRFPALASLTRGAFTSLERAIEAGKKLNALVGKEAPPIEAIAWVNGPELTPSERAGKVLLLDFWAIWCGPCIATFPHLREWQEKYVDKGLVIVGLTRYYEYEWNDEAQRPKKGDGVVTPEAEQEMLKKFANFHSLKHRFAIQEDNDLSEFFGVTGIPHAVVIDQQNKVRLIRVGSGEANAQAISKLLAELLPDAAAEKPATEKAAEAK
ncbi:MAG: TlpA disulfide reductase family protein [Pirellulaceae bacterium]|nr:TlpA disulfide reductase family protein [Pirellulaceae bacterium]